MSPNSILYRFVMSPKIGYPKLQTIKFLEFPTIFGLYIYMGATTKLEWYSQNVIYNYYATMITMHFMLDTSENNLEGLFTI